MKRNGWTKNLGPKIGASVVALTATLGFYGMIQANPLMHTNTPSAPSGSAASAPAPSTDDGGSAFGAAPSNSAANGSTFAPAPVAGQPITRTTHS